MNFLTNLLPGVRELRAPLAAGYLWLAVAWLHFHSHVPRPAVAVGLLDDIYAVANAAGQAAQLAALSFCAYLIGVLSVGLSSAILKVLAARREGVRRLTRRSPSGRDPIVLGDYMKELIRCGVSSEKGESYLGNSYFAKGRRVMRSMPRDIAVSSEGVEALRELIVGRLADRLAAPTEADLEQIDEAKNLHQRTYLPEVVGWDAFNCLFSARSDSKKSGNPGRRRPDRRYTVLDGFLNTISNALRLSQVLSELTPGKLEAARRRAILRDALDVDYYMPSILDSIREIPNRLLGSDPDLYGMYDRLKAEAEFRAAVTIPLWVLAFTLLDDVSPWWAAVVAFLAVGLGRSAIARLRLSGDTLAEALRAGRDINVPAVDELAVVPLVFRYPQDAKLSIFPGIPYK